MPRKVQTPEERKALKRERNKIWFRKNRDKTREYSRQYRQRAKPWKWEKNKAKMEVYREENRETILEQQKEYNKREDVRKRNSEHKKKRYHERKSDPEFILTKNLRNRMRKLVKALGVGKAGRFNELVGCDGETLKQHLESQFHPGMSWDNYGSKDGWVVDHIVPCALFDLTKDYQQKSCFNYKNLQPMWYSENASKKDTLEVCPV